MAATAGRRGGRQLENLVGRRFGMLTVTEFSGYRITPSGQRIAQWNCACDCGVSKIVSGRDLRIGDTTSCGCVKRRNLAQGLHRSEDLTGLKFGRLTVIKRIDDRVYKNCKTPVWLCKCECGHFVEVLSGNLKVRNKWCRNCVPGRGLRTAYQEAYGRIPDGYVVTPLDGDTNNCAAINLVAIPRQDYNLMVTRGLLVKGDSDLKLATIQTIALERAIAKMEENL